MLLELIARSLFGPSLSALKLQIQGQPKILILGNSHPFAALDPSLFSRPALNMADNSRTVYYDNLVFERMAGQADTLVLGLDFFSLSLDQPENVVDYLAAGYPPRQGVTLMQRLQLHSVLLRHRTIFLERLTQGFRPPLRVTPGPEPPDPPSGKFYLMSTGWLALNGTVADEMTPEHGLNVVQHHLAGASSEVRAVFVPLLHELVARAVERKMKVLIVVCPASPAYRQWVPEAALREFAEELRALRQPYSPDQLRIWWRYDDPSYGPDMFHNVDHLNIEGAHRFSREVDEFLKTNF